MVGIRLHSIALHVCLLLVWCNSFPKGCSETSARAPWCTLFCAMIAGGDALGFSLDSPSLVKRRFRSAAWPPFETAERDLIENIFSGPNGGYYRRFWKRRTKSPKFPCSLGTHSAVEFCGLTAERNHRSTISKGKLVFSHALFLMSINILLSHYLNMLLEL